MGWAWLAALAAAGAAGLWVLGFDRRLYPFAGAALMLAATGYALQGRPAQPGSPRQADAQPIEIDPGLIDLRNRMTGGISAATAYLAAADAMERTGAPDSAIRVLLAGIQKMPRNMALWTALGDAYALNDGGLVSPPALFAFRNAVRLAPSHPAPPFFLGLAYVREGDFAKARPLWVRALALTPDDLSYRPEIAVRLELLDRYLAMMETAR